VQRISLSVLPIKWVRHRCCRSSQPVWAQMPLFGTDCFGFHANRNAAQTTLRLSFRPLGTLDLAFYGHIAVYRNSVPYPFIETPQELLILRLIHGLATAIYGPVTMAWVIEQGQQQGNSSNNCAERLGWFGMARSGGYLLGPTIAAALLLVFEPSTVFTVIGLLSSCALLPVLLLKNSAPRNKPKFHSGNKLQRPCGQASRLQNYGWQEALNV